MAQPGSRPFITCHVLETTSGRPATNMGVSLTLLSPSTSTSTPSEPYSYSATTNTDGRVTSWTPTSPHGTELSTVVASARKELELKGGEQMVWSLKFETGAFYGEGRTFWPEVELSFFTRAGEEHYHVPLLLGPWSYTTYRGS